MAPEVSELLIREVRLEAEDVVSVALEHPRGDRLESWEPGAHIDLVLPSGIVRQYSLCGDPGDLRGYRIAVLRQPHGRGGSLEVHDGLRVGATVGCSRPRNLFDLVAAPHYVLIAGGVGVTPIITMAEELTRRGASWTMVYGGRSRQSMAFLERLATFGERVSVVPQDEAGVPDLAAALSGSPNGTVVYCCGPEAMLDAARDACVDLLGAQSFHCERFGAGTAAAAADGDPGAGFEVELRRSGVVLTVPADRTILDVVREVNPDVAYSCEDGFCGSCEMKVLDGVPLHRDSVLTKAEQESGTTMMICVSRSQTPRLVLDA